MLAAVQLIDSGWPSAATVTGTAARPKITRPRPAKNARAGLVTVMALIPQKQLEHYPARLTLALWQAFGPVPVRQHTCGIHIPLTPSCGNVK